MDYEKLAELLFPHIDKLPSYWVEKYPARKLPEGAKVTASADGLNVSVTGIDKQLVGRVAADLRSYYPAEPYKGKGVRYADEKIRRKEGKTVA